MNTPKEEAISLPQNLQKTKPRKVLTAISNNNGMKGALIGAALAVLVGAATNFLSNYLTRHDLHVHEAEKCKSLVRGLITNTLSIQATVEAASSALSDKSPMNKDFNKFILPPFDEVLHAQEQWLDGIDSKSRQHILSLEMYYRTVRDDLSNTPGNYHSGETFGVPPTTGNQEPYKELLGALSRTAEAARADLRATRTCDNLAKTALLWQDVRQVDEYDTE